MIPSIALSPFALKDSSTKAKSKPSAADQSVNPCDELSRLGLQEFFNKKLARTASIDAPA